MRLATALLFLARAATACPSGWTPSPNSGTCFKVPPERSTSLFRCVELCEEHGGAPACIGSAEENRHVTANERKLTDGADVLWLGLYQNETSLGPAKGWGGCVSGDAPNFTNWYEGQPDDHHGYQQECTLLAVSDLFGAGSGNGTWRDGWCDSSVLYRASHRAGARRCLCAHGEKCSEIYLSRGVKDKRAFTTNITTLLLRT